MGPAGRPIGVLYCLLSACSSARVVPSDSRPAETSAAGTARRTAMAAGIDWLARHQDADGSWKGGRFVERCAGPGCGQGPVFAVDESVTGLSLLALQGAPRGVGDTAAAREARRRGVGFLTAAQAADGRVGSVGGHTAHFNHILPALALLEEAGGADASPAVRDAARKALDAAARQARREVIDDCEGNWYARAFAEGGRLGWVESGPLEDRVLYWMDWARKNSQNVTRAPPAGWALCLLAAGRRGDAPEVRARLDEFANAPPESDKADFFLWVLGTTALQESGDARAEAWARAVEARLLALQRPPGAGCAAGSWDPDPMWGSAGGRIYATALGVMILERAEGGQ